MILGRCRGRVGVGTVGGEAVHVTARGGGPAPPSVWVDRTGGRYLVVTLPLPFDGRRRARTADEALAVLRGRADGRLVVAGTAMPPREENGSMAEMFIRCDGTVPARLREVLIG